MLFQRLDVLPKEDVEYLADVARTEGYRFLERLIAEWQKNVARFDKPGECLIGAFADGKLVAIGGIHRDPYLSAIDNGRIRRLYVLPEWRRRGVAAALVTHLLRNGQDVFCIVRLRVPNRDAALFYEAIGFACANEPSATHAIRLPSQRTPA